MRKRGKESAYIKKVYSILFSIQSSIFPGSDLCGNDQPDRSGISADSSDNDKDDFCGGVRCDIKGTDRFSDAALIINN